MREIHIGQVAPYGLYVRGRRSQNRILQLAEEFEAAGSQDVHRRVVYQQVKIVVELEDSVFDYLEASLTNHMR